MLTITKEGAPPPRTDTEIASEIATGRLPNEFRAKIGVDTRILAQTESLVLMPTVSPLCLGHVLLFARGAHLSFAELLRSRSSVASELNRMAALYDGIFGHPVWFEHGSVPDGTVACGVTRAHLHLVPRSQIKVPELTAALDFEIGPAAETEFLQLKKIRSEYIFVSDNIGGSGKVWVGRNLPSQIVRRHLAQQLALSEWNWRSLFGWNVVRDTIAMWERSGASHAPAD
jgi:hypothetical protein